jgi:hypothetical protein
VSQLKPGAGFNCTGSKDGGSNGPDSKGAGSWVASNRGFQVLLTYHWLCTHLIGEPILLGNSSCWGTHLVGEPGKVYEIWVGHMFLLPQECGTSLGEAAWLFLGFLNLSNAAWFSISRTTWWPVAIEFYGRTFKRPLPKFFCTGL